MLSSFLFTPKQQRLLAAVMLHPAREYTFTELQENVKGGVSSLQAYVLTLVRAGVLRVRQDRASKRYSANTQHPLFPELRSIAVKSFAVLEPIREALAPLSDLIQRAFIFGSIVKGTADHESDIDLMVIGHVSTGKVHGALKKVAEILGRPVHVNVYGADEWETLLKADPVIKSIAEGPLIELHLAQAADGIDDHAAKHR